MDVWHPPTPAPPRQLCDGVREARAAPHAGHLVDEMHLYSLLMRIMRSPEALIRITRRKND